MRSPGAGATSALWFHPGHTSVDASQGEFGPGRASGVWRVAPRSLKTRPFLRRGRLRKVAKQLVLRTPGILCPFERMEGGLTRRRQQLHWVWVRLELLLEPSLACKCALLCCFQPLYTLQLDRSVCLLHFLKSGPTSHQTVLPGITPPLPPPSPSY